MKFPLGLIIASGFVFLAAGWQQPEPVVFYCLGAGLTTLVGGPVFFFIGYQWGRQSDSSHAQCGDS